MIIVQKAGDNMLKFDTVSYAPIDKNLIDISMLTSKEKEWLNSYHLDTFEALSPLLDDVHVKWLREKTSAI